MLSLVADFFISTLTIRIFRLKEMSCPPSWTNDDDVKSGKYYFADLRMTFRQNFFLQDWFRNKLGVGLG